MNKRVVFFLSALILAAVNPTEAQPAKKMAPIGFLSPQSGPSPTLVAFKEGLRELGWVEGKQIEFEYRYAGGDLDKLSEFATELVRLKLTSSSRGLVTGRLMQRSLRRQQSLL
jgi:putative tryptophan/tyrosine transport system substrate-binding protein